MTKALAWPASLMRHVWETAKLLIRRLLLERDYYQFTRIRIALGRGWISCELQTETMLTTPCEAHPSRPASRKPRLPLKAAPVRLERPRSRRSDDERTLRHPGAVARAAPASLPSGDIHV
jgi:hypothetical protein